MGTFAIALLLQAAGQVFDQAAAGDRLVVIETDHFAAHAPVGGKTWTVVNAGTAPAAPAGFVGTNAMAILPDANTGTNAGAATFVNGARLDFRVLFRFAGTHYLWVRGRSVAADSGNSDSCHVAIDGTAAAGGFQLQGFAGGEWRWIRNANGATATISVPTTGVHTISLYMREDGFFADRLLLTSNPAYTLNPVTVEGPAESAQIADLTPDAATAPDLAPGINQIQVSWDAVANAETYRLERSDDGGNWQVVFSGDALSYTDANLNPRIQRCYRVAGVHGVFGAGPVSPVNCAFALFPPPRTNDHDEGAFGENCACGSRIPASTGTSLAGLAAALLLLAFRRR